MHILLISSYLPYPLFSGGHVRLYNLIKQLHKKHTITLVCEKRPHQTDADIAALRALCDEVVVIARKKQWSIPNVLSAGFSAYPFLMVGHTNDAMKRAIQKQIREKKFDCIHVETFYVMQNIPETMIPIVLVEHNVEYLVYERYANQLPFFLRPLLSIDIAKMRYWERYFWKKATKLVAVSEIEKQEMERNDVVVVPNGVDIATFNMKHTTTHSGEQKILYMGDFKWIQNTDACIYLLTEVWPKILSSYKKGVTLWIVGKHIPQRIKDIPHEGNVLFDENANDTAAIFQEATILLAPIRVGGGTSFKILEAMAAGVPVITTPLGIAGLEAKEGEHALVGNNNTALASNVISLLDNKTEAKRLAKNARELIERKYNWETIGKILEEVYIKAV